VRPRVFFNLGDVAPIVSGVDGGASFESVPHGRSTSFGLRLSHIIEQCESCTKVCPDPQVKKKSEEAFLTECIALAGSIWSGVVVPFCRRDNPTVKIFRNSYIAAVVPALLEKVRVHDNGKFVAVTGDLLANAFKTFFLGSSGVPVSSLSCYANATNILIMVASVGNVDFEASG